MKWCSKGHARNDIVAIQTPSPFAPKITHFSWYHTNLQGQNESKKSNFKDRLYFELLINNKMIKYKQGFKVSALFGHRLLGTNCPCESLLLTTVTAPDKAVLRVRNVSLLSKLSVHLSNVTQSWFKLSLRQF